MGRAFQSKCILLVGTEVQRNLHLHEKNPQVLAGCVIIGKEEINWPPCRATASTMMAVEVTRLCALGHTDRK